MRMKSALVLSVSIFPIVVHAAGNIRIHTEAARQTLNALQDPALTRERALAIAKLHGNQGVIRKDQEFGFNATTESFASALYDAAHDHKVFDPVERSFLFDMIKPKAKKLLAVLRQIECSSESLQSTVQARIAPFSPLELTVDFDGYVVAAGDGGGYAFDDTDFFLNLGITDDFPYAKETTTHELYHSIQNLFKPDRKSTVEAGTESAKEACSVMDNLLSDLYDEGTATYVGDVSLLSQSQSRFAKRADDDLKDGIAHIQDSVTLLDLSILGLQARPPVPYDDIYAIDFLGHGTLYSIGFVMAKAIAEHDGPQGLAILLKQRPYHFILRYTQLPKYGMDSDHPKLGQRTIDAVYQFASGCQ